MLNFFKQKKIEEKSYNSSLKQNSNPTTSASVFIGGDGSLLNTIFYNAFDEIGRNISVNTIINKQNSIVNEATLVVKEKDNLENESTSQKEFLDFLDNIENPNSYPFPRSRTEIFKYILSNSYKKGIFGVIYVFDKNKNFKHIKIPVSINLQKFLINETKYQVYFSNTTYEFSYSQKYRNFGIETESEIMILQVGGNFDNDLQDYSPIFRQALPYILLQNYLIDFATSFHQNACFPSQIITINYITDKDNSSGVLSPQERKEFDDAVKSIQEQIMQSKGSKNSGGIIIPKNPNIKIDIKPLSIPTGAGDNIKYQDFVSTKIYATVDGGSVDAFEGKSEYSNNASAKLQDLYDGSFRLFNSLVIDPMNQFMQGLVGSFYKDINPKNYYLSFDVSNVRIYQKQFIAQDVMLVQNNMLKIKDAQTILKKTSVRYSFITPDPELDLVNAQLSGNATKPRVEIKGISTKPTEEMVKNASRALEWRKEFNRGATEVGVARARDIINEKNLSLNTIKRMVSFFARHEVDKKAKGFYFGDENFPSAGRIAWDAWGGDAGRSWALDKLRQLEPDNQD
jgi:hypothetical protein